MCVHVCAGVCACVYVHVCVHVCAGVCACVCIRGRREGKEGGEGGRGRESEGGTQFGSTIHFALCDYCMCFDLQSTCNSHPHYTITIFL